MLSIKPSHICLFIFLLPVLLVGCSGKEKKPEESKDARIKEDVQQQAGTQSAEGVQQVEPLPIVETEEQMRERLRLEQLAQFGSDPYPSSAPPVPAQAQTDFAAAMNILNSGDLVAAEKELVRLIDVYPTLSGPAYNLAVMKAGQEDYKGALQYVETAILRNTFNLHAHLLKAYLHRENGSFDLAEKEYLEIIQMWGGFLPAYKNLGILYDLYMGKIDNALVYYKKYNSLLAEPEKQVSGWIADIERQLKE